jgi:hypothetical protein
MALSYHDTQEIARRHGVKIHSWSFGSEVVSVGMIKGEFCSVGLSDALTADQAAYITERTIGFLRDLQMPVIVLGPLDDITVYQINDVEKFLGD